MSRTNNSEHNDEVVTDEEIQIALEVLDALKDELKAHTKRRMDRIPNNEAWNERATHIDYDLRGSLDSIHGLKQELKQWAKRRLKKPNTSSATDYAPANDGPNPHRH
jgi:hypothetical protein